ncbi:MAG: hypothetical protein H6818_21005 [Phycisphaerales bacterium]|nr:hypothetical protein [Phycisphaerales bacterium]MCB9862271.1 hypothetical protein [Phycisphaerales bacterium]
MPHSTLTPPIVRRRLRWGFVATVVVLTLLIGGKLLHVFDNPRAGNVAYALALGAAVYDVLILVTSIRYWRRRALETEGQLCLNCGYILAGLPDSDACPDCGRQYVMDDTRSTWLQWCETPRTEQ